MIFWCISHGSFSRAKLRLVINYNGFNLLIVHSEFWLMNPVKNFDELASLRTFSILLSSF